MNQRQLEREISRKTGMSVAEIRRHGFSLATPIVAAAGEPIETPQFIDWDADAEPPRPYRPAR